MIINHNNTITELTTKVFEEYDIFTTKCAVELIKFVGLQISDSPTNEELEEIVIELKNRDYSFVFNRHRGGIRSIELYHNDNLIAGYKFEMIWNEDELSYKINATPI